MIRYTTEREEVVRWIDALEKLDVDYAIGRTRVSMGELRKMDPRFDSKAATDQTVVIAWRFEFAE